MTTPPFRPWDDGWEGPDDDPPEEPWSATFETDERAAVDETDDWPEWNTGPEYRMYKDLLEDILRHLREGEDVLDDTEE